MSHAAAKTMVIGILGENSVIAGIHFQMRGIQYTPQCLREVRTAILDERIHVRHWPQGGTGYASYYSTGSEETRNTIYTGFTSVVRPTQQALIVHECMHAYCDLRNFRWMHVNTSEAVAWLAQCIALRNLGLTEALTGSSQQATRFSRRNPELSSKQR